MDTDPRIKILEILARQTDMTLATLRGDGYPQATTVSYVSDALDIYFATPPTSQKARNVSLVDTNYSRDVVPVSLLDAISGNDAEHAAK